MATNWSEAKYEALTRTERQAEKPSCTRVKSVDPVSTHQMLIHEMSREACLQVLAGTRLARLACAHENQPYIVPVYLAYDETSNCLYGVTTPGQKVNWMRANSLVCVEVGAATAYDHWITIIALGRYEELSETSGNPEERRRAWQALQTQPEWWEPGSTASAARAHGNAVAPFVPVYYKIWIEQVTGHEATRLRDAISCAATAPLAGKAHWLRRALSYVFG